MNNKDQTNSEKATPEKRMTNGQKVRLVLSAILAIFLIIFAVQNSNKVEVEFLNFTKRVPVVVIILVSMITGGILTYLLTKYRAVKKKKK